MKTGRYQYRTEPHQSISPVAASSHAARDNALCDLQLGSGHVPSTKLGILLYMLQGLLLALRSAL